MTAEDDDRFAGRTKKLFDESVDSLDAATLSRLNRGRQAALAAAGRRPAVGWGWLPAAGAVATVAIAVMLRNGVGDVPAEAAVSDFEILMAGEDLEMLEDLDFYRWLDEESDALPDDHVG